MKSITLGRGRDKSLRRRHPWIFSGGVARVEGAPEAGETVRVLDATGTPVALAAWSPQSQIRARVWSFDPDTPVDAAFFEARLAAALALRAGLPASRHSNALRLVHGESDGLPGLVVDRYADVVVAQFLSAGAEHWRELLLGQIAAQTGCESLYERSDAEVRALEGLAPRSGWVQRPGGAPGLPGAGRCAIVENGLSFRVDVEAGQKTGFFLDQRDNRQRVRQLAAGRAVLDAFCYTGGFAVAALAGGAKRVLALDSSAPALEVARENARANGYDDARVTNYDDARVGNYDDARVVFEQADVFKRLRQLRDAGEQFGLIVLDPPKFAPTAAQAHKAARAYKDINLLALKLLAPGGLLATFSCSGGVNAALFQSIVAGAALDAGVEAKILERFSAAPDHPVALPFPEGDYLKGLLILRG